MAFASQDSQELSVLDGMCSIAGNTIMAYVLGKKEDIYDAGILVNALARVTKKWRMLAGRVVRDKKTKKFHVHVPPEQLGRSPFKFTTATYNESIHIVPLTRTCIISQPARKYFYHPSTPATLSGYATSDHPILSVHISYLNDATCIGFCFPHGIFDGTGAGHVLQAISAEIAGQEWISPPITSSSLVDTVFAELAQSPNIGETSVLGIVGRSPMFVPFDLSITRGVFLDKETVDRMVHEINQQIKEFDNEKWVSTNDILSAWFLRTAMGADKNIPAITVATAISFRDTLAPLYPGFGTNPHNCVVPCPMPRFSSSWLRGSTIAEFALSHRAHINRVRSLAFVQFLARFISERHCRFWTVDRHWNEPSFTLSNQSKCGITNIDFGAGTQVQALWEFNGVIQPDSVCVVTKFKEGYIFMATMRKSRWDSVSREVERIRNGGRFV